MLTTQVYGVAGIHVRYGTAATAGAMSIDSLLLEIPEDTTHFIRFSSQSTALDNGNLIYGDTSDATAYITGVVTLSGTVAGGDAEGILFVKDVSGTFAAENITLGSTTPANDATVIAAVALKVTPGRRAIAAFCSVEDFAMSVTWDGTIPTISAATDMGHEFAAASKFWVYGHENIKNMQFINTADASGAIFKVTLFY